MNEKLRALYKGALQGSTMGLADEAIGGIGAFYARTMAPELFQGDSFLNTYKQARDLDRAENKQLEQNNHWTYGGANLVGGVAMPLGMAGQGLKGAVKAGGIAGGLTGYGMSEKTNPYALALDTATGAGLGAGAGAALYGAGKVATNPQVQKFAKDYIADESGALRLLPDEKLYHGTNNAFDNYNLKKTNSNLYGKGVYLTKDNKIANAYADAFDQGDFTKNPNVRIEKTNANLLDLSEDKLSEKDVLNIFGNDAKEKGVYKELVEKVKNNKNADGSMDLEWLLRDDGNHSYNVFGKFDWQKSLQKSGYDGLAWKYLLSKDGSKAFNIFDPKKLKPFYQSE